MIKLLKKNEHEKASEVQASFDHFNMYLPF